MITVIHAQMYMDVNDIMTPLCLLRDQDDLVVIRMCRICQIKNHRGMRFRPSAIRIRPCKINGPVKVQRAIGIDVDIQRLIIRRGVDEAYIARLDEVVRNDNVLLVRGDFDVVRADGGLDFIRVIEAFDVFEVRDVECSDVVCGC